MAKAMSVQVKECQLRSQPTFLGKIVTNLELQAKKEAVRVYEPLALSRNSSKELYESFNRALCYFYEGNMKQALAEFSKTADQDNAAKSYVLKCREFIDRLPEPWAGVWELDSK